MYHGHPFTPGAPAMVATPASIGAVPAFPGMPHTLPGTHYVSPAAGSLATVPSPASPHLDWAAANVERQRAVLEAEQRDREAEMAALEREAGAITQQRRAVERDVEQKVAETSQATLNAALWGDPNHDAGGIDRVRQTTSWPGPDGGVTPHGDRAATAARMAEENLEGFGLDLGVKLKFDNNWTCQVGVDGKYNVLITFDHATQRLYLYATLLNYIPKAPPVRLMLYEYLMMSSLLGREIAGGGIGASVEFDYILLTSSLDMGTSTRQALASLAPGFIDSLVKWRKAIRDLLMREEEALREYLSHRPPNWQGEPVLAVIGLEVTDAVNKGGEIRRCEDGVVVIEARGPAMEAGVMANDVICSINGKNIRSLLDFQDIGRNLVAGEVAQLLVNRAGQEMKLALQTEHPNTWGQSSTAGHGQFHSFPRTSGHTTTHDPTRDVQRMPQPRTPTGHGQLPTSFPASFPITSPMVLPSGAAFHAGGFP